MKLLLVSLLLVSAHAAVTSQHPMYRNDAMVAEPEEHERMLAEGCTYRRITVRESEYDVDYKAGDIQYGVTPIYDRDANQNIGDWYWEWVDDSYGTMLIYWNERESIFFGFSSRQSYYPIAGGYLVNNHCPHGYVRFVEQEGDVRWYSLYVCGGC